MKHRYALFLLAILFVAGVPARPAAAQVGVGGQLYYGSPYVFRGAVFSSGWVFQPTVALTAGDFTFGFFGNVDPGARGARTGVAFNEADLFAGYGFTRGGAAASLTYTFYTFPGYGYGDTGTDFGLGITNEVALALGLDAPLAPALYLVYDFDENDESSLKGFYGELGVTAPFRVGSRDLSFGLKGAADYGYLLEDADGDDQFGIAHVTLSAGTLFELGAGLTLSPLAALQIGVDDTYRALAGPTLFYGGLTVGF